MSARAYRNGPSRTSAAGYKRDRRLARRVLPRHCARCGETDNLELDHILSVADHTAIHGEPPVDGECTAADVHERYQWLCASCHKVKTQHERSRGIRRTNDRKTGKRPPPVHPSEVLGARPDTGPIGVWRPVGRAPR